MTLDVAAAERAVRHDVGEPMGVPDAAEAAAAVSEIVDENMAAAARAHAAEWGKAAAGRTLIAFGGAAPIHAVRIAEKLDLQSVVVPPAAGVGSAVGFLEAPVAFEVVRSRYLKLSAFDTGIVAAVMAEMRAEARAVVGAIVSGPIAETRRAYMRYLGQGFEIAVDVPEPISREALRQAFDAAYEQLYGRLIPGLDVEVLSWTLTLQGERPPSVPTAAGALRPGGRVEGPTTIIEEQTAIVVPDGFAAEADRFGNVVLRRTSGP